MHLPIRGKPVALEWERERFLGRPLHCCKTSAELGDNLKEHFQLITRQ